MTNFDASDRIRIRRAPERGIYDRETIFSIIDEALICHIGFVQGGQPIVIPTIHARDDNGLLIHGATSSRLIRHVQDGKAICVTITILDGLVIARSIYHHSMNYRSVVLFGTGRIVDDPGEKLAGLERLSEHIMPGRWNDARKPNENEFKATAVVSITIDEASAKVRSGPPGEEDEDYQLPIWAGVLPIRQTYKAPENDPRLMSGLMTPEYVTDYERHVEESNG